MPASLTACAVSPITPAIFTNGRGAACSVALGRLRRQLQDRVIQSNAPDRELRRMHADGDPAGAGRHVVARQRPLRALVQRPRCGQGQRMRRDDLACEKVLANVHGGWAPASDAAARRDRAKRFPLPLR